MQPIFSNAFVSSHCSSSQPRGTEMRVVSPGVDIALVSSSVALLSGYQLRLIMKERNEDNGEAITWRQYQADAREAWARHVR